MRLKQLNKVGSLEIMLTTKVCQTDTGTKAKEA